jgi:HSP20 family protein
MVRALRPWRETAIRPLEDLYKEMDNLVSHFFGDDRSNIGDGFAPRVNLVETEAEYEVTADLPGIDVSHVNVELHEGQLTISGKRAMEEKKEGKSYLHVERAYGEFRRVIPIAAPVDEQKISAEYKDGVLKVVLPKSSKVRPTKITVTSGTQS